MPHVCDDGQKFREQWRLLFLAHPVFESTFDGGQRDQRIQPLFGTECPHKLGIGRNTTIVYQRLQVGAGVDGPGAVLLQQKLVRKLFEVVFTFCTPSDTLFIVTGTVSLIVEG